jgi:hypothetical protein
VATFAAIVAGAPIVGPAGLSVNVYVELPTITVTEAAAGAPMVTPCTFAEAMTAVIFHAATLLVTALFARIIEFADLKDPKTPFADESCALPDKFMYEGIATAARMPNITMTMTSSISVKPFCFLNIFFSSFVKLKFKIQN